MQEILVDVVDTILKNRVLYTALRSSLTKTKGAADASETVAATSQKLGESAESDRTTALLRSGLVDKSQITAARKALKSKSNMKSMSMGKVYREMMINMLDSMVKKITGTPALFNAFKYTMGKEVVEEDFDWGCEESIALVGLHEDAQEILEANKPTNPSLWSQAKAAAKSKFKVYPSAYANGWAVKWYNSKGGGWKSVSEGKTFFDFMTDLQELSKKTKDAYVAKRGSQLQRMTTGLDHYRNLLTGRQQANAVKGIKRATGVKEEAEQIDELSKKTLASYVQGAHRSQGMHEWESGNKAAKGEYYQNKKYIKREIGIGRALNRLQKEAVETTNLDPKKYYAVFDSYQKVIHGPYASEKQAWHDMRGDVTDILLGEELGKRMKKGQYKKFKMNIREAVESGQLTPEEQEIYLTAVNTESIYRSRITPIIKNYQRKLGKGKYNPELAIKGFVYAVEDAIKEYAKYGSKIRLTGEQKRRVAKELLDHFADEINPEGA